MKGWISFYKCKGITGRGEKERGRDGERERWRKGERERGREGERE
jgi:hypothetical protein